MMWPSDLFAGRRYAVLGLGRNGLPVVNALRAMGAYVAAWDDTLHPEGIVLEDPAAAIATFDALVLSPGIPHRLPKPHPTAAAAIAARIPVISDADLLFQAVRAAGSRARFIGVTGTNGKSTTTALLAHIFSNAGWNVAAGGNLGTASLALPLLDHHGLYILEMSSYMLERIGTLRFDAAVMLNLSPDHLDRHGTMAGYAAAKRAIFARQRPGDLAVIGVDDADSRAMAEALGAVTVSGKTTPAAGPALPGEHNAQNAAAARLVAEHFGVPDADIASGIASFPGLPHRQQVVATVDGVPYVDDSKATNADAAARALACYERIIWIAGGVAKAGGAAPLAPFFPRIAHALLIGRDAPILAADLADVPHSMAGTLENAVPAARTLAADLAADVVLLSPACASFDQFSGFEARGLRFAELARGLV